MLLKLSPYPNAFSNKARKFCQSLWVITVLSSLLFVNVSYAKEAPAKSSAWVGTWATAPQLVEPNNMPPAPGLSNNTLRQVVCVSIGGKHLQIKFSNAFSKSLLTLKSVQIAVSKGKSAIDESTTKTLNFNGKPEVTMEPGAEIMCDPVSFDLKPRMEIAITIAFGETSTTLTGHPGSRTTSYLVAGNQTVPNADFTNAVNTDHWYVITGIDVEDSKAAAVAVIGDSITDGRGSGTNKKNRWTDVMEMSFLKNAPKRRIGVLNLGIGGNCVLRGGLGPTALNRFDRDILKQNGVRWLIIFEGINDLGGTRDSLAAQQVAKSLIAAYDKMITEAHIKRLKVYGATILPFKKSFYYTDYRETARNTVNEWIRAKGHFDAVIDFDKAVKDPNDALTMLSNAQSGDYLHPNEDGYKMLGEAIDLSLFK